MENILSEELLESGGLYDTSTVFKKNQYWCDVTRSNLKIFRHDTLKDLLERVYEEGLVLGRLQGKEQRSTEIKKLLNIE